MAAPSPCHKLRLEKQVSTFIRWAALGVLISTMEIIGASAQAYYPPAPAYAAPARPATALPEVFVPGQGRTAPHYRVPAGYDSDVALPLHQRPWPLHASRNPGSGLPPPDRASDPAVAL